MEQAELQVEHSPRNRMEQAAISYAAQGLRILPLIPRGKTPYKGNGVTHATTDNPQIVDWFSQEPDINIGIATGDGLVVLDADSEEAAKVLAGLQPTASVKTSRGKHFYFLSPEHIKNSVKKLRKDVDVRGQNGYVVAPPSVHPDGTLYEWDDRNVPIATLPRNIEFLLGSPRLDI